MRLPIDSDQTIRPVLLLCECAGTMTNIDFDMLQSYFSREGQVLRDRHWCGREGQARLLDLIGSGEGDRLVFAGCSEDFANRRFHKLLMRGLRLDIASIREGCSWVHEGADRSAVTEKARQIAEAVLRYPAPKADRRPHETRIDAVLVIGGGVAGTQAAVEIAQMGHYVELIEERPFLGGRAALIGTVFPTNDCGQCLPTTDAQLGIRKCFHRNLAIDHPNLHIRRRTTVESVTGSAGNFEVSLHTLPNLVTDGCINCGACETVCGEASDNPGGKAIFAEFYDGRVNRTVDMERCSFCGACAEACPVNAIDFRQSPQRTTVKAGAILIAVGCEPAPGRFLTHLGYGQSERVVTQNEFTELLASWEELAAIGRPPAKEVVIIQCAGSRDKRFVGYCSRLCCMIALRRAIRLRTLFPEIKVTICYMELTTPGATKWYLVARRLGVEFLRGLPSEVQLDADGAPVVEVEDMMLCEKRVLRPDLVVLSSGMAPAKATMGLSQSLGVALDYDGFIEILDSKNRATETTREGIFVCGSASGPKAIVECNTEASAVASEIHNFLTSSGRLSAPASEVDRTRCVGCGACVHACPYGAISLTDRDQAGPRPSGVRDDAQAALVDRDSCRACGACSAICPEMAIKHYFTDETLSGRLATLAKGVDRPVVGFYCRECAGAAINLSGMRHDGYPTAVRLIELPCLGLVSTLHILEAVRKGACGVFLAGCAEGRCQFRKGDLSAAEQVRASQALLDSMGLKAPVELWHLCAVDRRSVGRRIRLFSAAAIKNGIHRPRDREGEKPCVDRAGMSRESVLETTVR